MLPRPNTKHPAELWWSPKAKRGLQLPRLMTSPHLLCATPLKHIKYFTADGACVVGTSTRETPSPAPPAQKLSQYLPLPYQKVATALFPRCSAARWWSLNKQPDDLTPNILGWLRAAPGRPQEPSKEPWEQGRLSSLHQPPPPGVHPGGHCSK